MADFLLELRSEEIPARMQDKARDDLARLFAAELEKAGLKTDAIVTFATPRRLALIARDLPAETAAVSEEVKGPRVGAPPQALEGFLRKTGLAESDLVERDGVLFAVIDKPGRQTAEVLAEAIPAIVRGFPWPKSMRWGETSLSTESLRWVRPLHGIVALLGEDVVPCEIAGVPGASPGKVGTGFPTGDATIKSSAATVGHRFHHPGVITIGSAADYAEKLHACHVIVDQDERRAIIRDRATALAAEAGLELIADEGLVAENAGLTEWPVPLLGRFDEEFLQVPPEVIQLTARVNQKYFVCRDGAGKLANAFVCTANIDATDGGAKIVEGNRKVLAARLSDARFFYDTDLKVPLEEQAKKLEKIVFHEKLGTVADKVERVAKLARWLVEEGIVTGSNPVPATNRHPGEGRGPASDRSQLDPGLRRGGDVDVAALADQAERAARLAKADLVTGMVGEFPELQGLMGGYYAAAQGEDAAVADAIRDHYKPVGQGDDVPTAPVTVAVSLADKLDSWVGFFMASEKPTGSRDPFALRRAALAVLSLIVGNKLKAPIYACIRKAYDLYLYTPLIRSDLPEPYRSTRNRITQINMDQKWHDVDADLSASLKEDIQAFVLTKSAWFDEDNFPDRKDVRNFFFMTFPIVRRDVGDFFADRLKVQQREAGVRHDLIDAVFALGGEDDLVRLLARVRALQSFVGIEDGANLLAGYKRAANILKKEGWAPVAAGDDGGVASLESDLGNYTPEPAEADLIAALDAAEPAAASAVADEDFEAAMAALATLRAPIDAFFDSVTVNDADFAKRNARLGLLARVRDAVHNVADFSKIEG